MTVQDLIDNGLYLLQIADENNFYDNYTVDYNEDKFKLILAAYAHFYKRKPMDPLKELYEYVNLSTNHDKLAVTGGFVGGGSIEVRDGAIFWSYDTKQFALTK